MRSKRIGFMVALSALTLAVVTSEARASDVKFGAWKKDVANDRYYCEMSYPSKADPKKTHTQLVVHYPNDKARSGYYYFANQKSEVWGRCVAPTSPRYDARVMQWSLRKGKKWADLEAGKCPAPRDGDPMRAEIGKVPLPPR